MVGDASNETDTSMHLFPSSAHRIGLASTAHFHTELASGRVNCRAGQTSRLPPVTPPKRHHSCPLKYPYRRSPWVHEASSPSKLRRSRNFGGHEFPAQRTAASAAGCANALGHGGGRGTTTSGGRPPQAASVGAPAHPPPPLPARPCLRPCPSHSPFSHGRAHVLRQFATACRDNPSPNPPSFRLSSRVYEFGAGT